MTASTARIVTFTLTSLDGAVADPTRFFPHDDADGAVDHEGPPGYDAAMVELEAEFIARQGGVLLGRRMYDQWSRYWPTSTEEPFAGFVNRTPKFVVTSSPLGESAWTPTTVALAAPLGDAVAEARRRTPVGDVGVHGSITLVRSLIAAGLADEIVLVVAPVLDPDGPRLFDGLPDLRHLELVSSRATGSGALWLTYRRR